VFKGEITMSSLGLKNEYPYYIVAADGQYINSRHKTLESAQKAVKKFSGKKAQKEYGFTLPLKIVETQGAYKPPISLPLSYLIGMN